MYELGLGPYPTKTPTEWWQCVRGTISIWLGLQFFKGDEYGYYDEESAIAWGCFYTYETDYGTGRGWVSLHVRGLFHGFQDDGDL